MVFLRWIRFGVLTLSVLLSAGVLALSASLIYSRSTEYLTYQGNDDDSSAHFSRLEHLSLRGPTNLARHPTLLPSGHDVDTVLTTAAAIITILTVPILLLVDSLKRKVWLSTLVLEASWLFILWAIWLSCGAYTAWCSQSNIVNFIRCQDSPSQCLQYKFLEVLSFVNWIALMLYANTLFTIAVINHMRRNPIWLERVRNIPRLPPVVLATSSILQVDERKAHSLTPTSSSSLLHQHLPQPVPAPTSTRQGHRYSSDLPSPLLPSIEESSTFSSPLTQNFVHTMPQSSTLSALPPTYTERPDARAPI